MVTRSPGHLVQGVRQSLACPTRLGQDMLLQRCPADESHQPPTVVTRSPTPLVMRGLRLAPPSAPVLPSILPQRLPHPIEYVPLRCVCAAPPGRNWLPGAGETPPQTGARLALPAPGPLRSRPDQPAP